MTPADPPGEPAAAPARRRASVTRRPQILRKAANLFQRNGYQATSMDEIAHSLRLNKATLYHHFPGGKSDLLFAINVTALDELLARTRDAQLAPNARDQLRATLRAMVKMQIDHPDEVAVYYEQLRWIEQLLPRPQHLEIRRREAAFKAELVAVLGRGIQTGAFRPVPPVVTAGVIINMAGSAYRMLSGADRASYDELMGVYECLLAGGLSSEPGPHAPAPADVSTRSDLAA